MSSNGLWKVTPQAPSMMGHLALGLSSGNSPRYSPKVSQDEPIDFSQKSESTAPSETSSPKNGEIRKKIKIENGAVPQNVFAGNNGYPLDNIAAYAALDQYYYVRDREPFARQLNGTQNNVHDKAEPARDSSPKIENGNPTIYLGAIRSPTSCPRTDVTSSRASPRSPEADAHMENLSSSSSIESDSNMANGREQLRSPEENPNSMDVGNGEGFGSPHMNGHIPNLTVPSTSSGIAHLMDNSAQFSSARILNSRGLSKLPQLTIPIMNPMNVRKSNGSSPRISTPIPTAAPFPIVHSPPTTAYEVPVTAAQLPGPWPVPYVQTSILQAQLEDKKSTKQVRPFKAFSNEIIKSCHPGLMTATLGRGSTDFEHFFKIRPDYFNQMTKNALLAEVVHAKKDGVSELPTTSDMTKYDCQSTTNTNGFGEASSSPEMVRKGNDSNDSSLSPRNDESHQQSSDNGSGRRKGNRYPENEKDPAYWERRRKNNEAAKRSRDARRRKEDALAMTAKELLEDKMRMSMHMTFQMKEMQKLEEENRFLKDRELTLKNYVYHLENRCRDCSTCNKLNPEKRPV